MKAVFFIIFLLPQALLANAIVPITNMWTGSFSNIYIGIFLSIVMIESLVLKVLIRKINWKKHLVASAIANLASSTIGSLIVVGVFEYKSSLLYSSDDFFKKFFIFFLVTILTEGVIFQLLYKKHGVVRAWSRGFTVNFFSYLILLVLEASILGGLWQYADLSYEAKKNKWKDATDLKTFPQTFIYSKYINSSAGDKFILIDEENRRTQILKDEKVQNISGHYIIKKHDFPNSDLKGVLLERGTEKTLLKIKDAHLNRIQESEELGLLLFKKGSALEGIPDSSGYRRIYGNSFKVFKMLSEGGLKQLELKDLWHGHIFKTQDGIIYTKHSKCAQEEETKLPTKICKNFQTDIVLKQKNKEITLVRDADTPQLVGETLFFLKNSQLHKKDMSTKEIKEVWDKEVSDYSVSSEETFAALKTSTGQPLRHSFFLLLLNLETKQKYIIDEGQIGKFDFTR